MEVISMESTESPEIEKITEALCKAQSLMDNAEKNSNNPHFDRKYSDLASVWTACRVPLTSNGIAIIQTPIKRGNEYVMRSKLSHTSGQWFACEIGLLMGRQDMQSLGSAMTYARRYGLMALAGIAPAEDDGNAAVGGKEKDEKKHNPNRERQAQEQAERNAQALKNAQKKGEEKKAAAAKSQDPLDGKIRKLFLDVMGARKGEDALAKRNEILKVLGLEDLKDVPAAPEIRKKDWIGQLTQMWEKEELLRQEKLIAEDSAAYEESALDEYNREQAGLVNQ
jgi:hypothetical protein